MQSQPDTKIKALQYFTRRHFCRKQNGRDVFFRKEAKFWASQIGEMEGNKEKVRIGKMKKKMRNMKRDLSSG